MARAAGQRAAAAPRRGGVRPASIPRADGRVPYATGFYDTESSGLEATTRFHEVMVAADVPYLMAILPEPALDPLNPTAADTRSLGPEEIELIARLRSDGVPLAQHGHDAPHQARLAAGRSELTGLSGPAAEELLDRGRSILRGLGIEPRVFVPPFNRFDAGSRIAEALRRAYD